MPDRFANWVGDGVGKPIIDGCQTGGVRVTEIGDLHRGGLVSEYPKPAIRGMPREIDQYVNSIAAHLLHDFRVGETNRGPPDVRSPSKPAGDGIVCDNFGVAIDLDLVRIVVLEDRLDKMGDGVVIKVGGHIPDA